MVSDGKTEWELRRERVDAAMQSITAGCLRDVPDELAEAIRYSLFAPGKRLRPILVMLGCEANGGTADAGLAAGCALEMVHTYSLIHDDLPAMDDDDFRRGRPTCHKQFGEALAILAGDALLTMAFQVVAEGYAPSTAAVMMRELAIGAGPAGMVGGQVLDLAAERRDPQTPVHVSMLESIHRAKTGALYRAALRMGYYAAVKDAPATLDALDTFGRCFGLAFQIQDDLLDVESSMEMTGKRTGKDAERGKLTYPGLLGVDASRQRAAQLCEDAIRSVTTIGPQAEPLVRLIRLVVERKR